MEYRLFCQVCCSSFTKVKQFKHHLISFEHKKEVGALFQQSPCQSSGTLPLIAFVDPNLKYKINKPVVGLSMVTLCFSTPGQRSFYLCHVCEKVCALKKIFEHIFSEEHYTNYLSNTNPDELNFSWIPNLDMKVFLFPKFKHEEGTASVLQILDLPKQLFDKLAFKPYSEVMNIFSENPKLYKQLKDFQPKRTDIHAYQNDINRKHPLLGMQHIVECISAGRVEERRYYLCTLCTRTVAAHVIIKHILSFHHIYGFINKWHPHTLMPKNSYTDYKAIASLMLDFARQMENIHGTSTMKQVQLQPGELSSMNITNYYEALKKLTSLRKDNFTVNVTPGKKLESRAPFAMPPSSLTHVKNKLHCQNCSDVFPINAIPGHLSNEKHLKMLTKFFGEAQGGFGFCQKVKVYQGLFIDICDRLRLNQQTVGTSLVVTCICSQVEVEPFSLCFACQESFLQSSLNIHFESKSHLINTLMYLNPWRLPFGCKQDLDESTLRLMAREEEGGGTDVILNVFDMPYERFWKLIPTDYRHVMNRLQVYHTLLKRDVPKKQTFSKLQQNEKFPLLGMQFLVFYNAMSSEKESVQKGLLCLLCKRKLMLDEATLHVFSWEHVVAFLNAFHPGSLNSSTVDAETLLDLAKQTGSIHPLSNVQEFCLEDPIIEPCSYQRVTEILASAKRREGKGSLEPMISAKMKLVPRNTQKVLDHSFVINKDTVKPGAVQIKEEKAEDNEKHLETNPLMSLKMCPKTEEAANQIMKMKTEVPSTEEPSKDSGRSDKSLNGNDRAQTKTKGVQTYKWPSETGEKKRKITFSDPSQEEKHHEDLQGGTSSKRPRLTSNIDGEESTVMSECEIKKEKTIEGDINKVSSKLIECRCGTHKPIYLCGRCMLRISDKDVLNHMNGFDHQEMFHAVFYTDEKMFVDISKQSFQSALDSLLGLDFDLPGHSKPPITSDSLCVEGSSYPQTMTQNDVDMEIDSEEDCSAATGLFMEIETLSRTNEAQMECGEAASDINACPSDPNTVSLFAGSNSPFNVSQTTSTESDKTTSSQKTTPTKLSAVISKATSKCVTETRLFERTESASKGGAFPTKVAHSPHADSSGSEVASKTHPSSRSAKTAVKPSVTNQNKVSPKMPTKSNEHGNNDPCARTAYRKKSVEANGDNVPHADERRQHPVGDPNPGLSTRSRQKNLCKESLHLSASKTIPSGNQEKIGTNHLIVVSWDGKQQVYCMLCLVKLNSSSSHHLISINHQYNYVKRKYPEWTAKPLEFESKLSHTVALLGKIERDLPHSRSVQRLQVTKDVYQDLGCLPNDEAVEKVKAMVRKKDPSDSVSSSVHNADEAPDPCEVSSSDDSVQAPQTETTGTSDHDVPEDLSSESVHQSEDDRIPGKTVERDIKSHQTAGKFIRHQSSDEFCSNVTLNQSDSEPVPSAVRLFEDISEDSQDAEFEEDAEVVPQNEPTPAVRSPEQRKQEQGLIAPAATTGQDALPTRVFIGGKARSSGNLSFYLKAGLHNSTAVIGKSCIWECQTIGQKTIFLCDCCEKKVLLRNICHHTISFDHQLKYLERDYPEYLQKFWYDEELLHEMKLDIFKAVVLKLSNQEHEQTMTEQCVCLGPELHGFIWNASFSEALKVVQSIKDEENQGVNQLPISVAEQETGQKYTCDLGASTVFGRMEVDCSSSNLDPVVPDSGLPHIPQSLFGGSHFESTPAGSRFNMFHCLNVNDGEESLKSTSPLVTPTVSESLNVSVGNERSSSIQRPADTSVETISSQNEDSLQAAAELNPLRAKAASSPPASESNLAHPAPLLTSNSPKEENHSFAPKSPKRNLKVLEMLISVLKKRISETVACEQSANSETVPESKLEQRQADNLLDMLQENPPELECNNQPGANYGTSSSTVGNTPTLPVQDKCSVSQPPSDSTTSNLNPGQIPESSGNPEIKSTAVCQSPIKTIITARQSPAFPLYQKPYQGEASRDHQSSIHADIYCDTVAAAQSCMSQIQKADTLDEPPATFQYAASHAAANNLQEMSEKRPQTSSNSNQVSTANLVNCLLLTSTRQSFSAVAFSEDDIQEQQQQQHHQVLQQQHHFQNMQVPWQQRLQQYQQMSQQQIMQQQVPQQHMQQQYQQHMQQQELFQQHLFQQQQNYYLWTSSWQSGQ